MTHLENDKGAMIDINERPNGLHLVLRYKGQMDSRVFTVMDKKELVERFVKEGFEVLVQ